MDESCACVCVSLCLSSPLAPSVLHGHGSWPPVGLHGPGVVTPRPPPRQPPPLSLVIRENRHFLETNATWWIETTAISTNGGYWIRKKSLTWLPKMYLSSMRPPMDWPPMSHTCIATFTSSVQDVSKTTMTLAARLLLMVNIWWFNNGNILKLHTTFSERLVKVAIIFKL